MSDRPPETVDTCAEDAVSSHCEYCGRRYWILPSQECVAHDVPYCPEFEAMDVLEFLRSNREIKQERRPRA